MISSLGAPRLPSAELPPPLDFVLEALAAEGALVERQAHEDQAVVLLPPRLASALELPEECQLALHPDHEGHVGAGLGTPLLEKLTALARAEAPAASVRFDLDPPRPAQVRALAERFVLRNGLSEIIQVSMGTAVYVAAALAYVAEADDRREGLVQVVVAPDGGEPDASLCALLDFTWPSEVARPSASPLLVEGAAKWVVKRAASMIRAAVKPLAEDVARRHARDHERIASYFTALITESRAPRRKTDPKTVEAKVAHLLAERDKKLHDLGARFAMRVGVTPAALIGVELPAALVSVRLRRRKAERAITLRVPAGAHAVDKMACEGCGAATGKPAACDEKMHLLCEACAPGVQGRIACPACGR